MRVPTLAIAILVTTLLVGCSRLPIADSGADVRLDTALPGPYAVGTADRSFTRSLPDGQIRTVPVSVKYPVRKQDGMPTDAYGITVTLEAPAAPGGPFPLVIFSHGSGARPVLYSRLINHLVSHGFAVAGPDHQDCPGRPSCTEQDRARAIENRPGDVIAVLDSMLALDAGEASPLKDLVDPARVGVAGHSFGGWTTLMVLERDPRFRAGLAMSPGTLNPAPDPARVARPLMLMSGVLDAMIPYALVARFFADIPPSAPDHYLLVAQQVGHEFHDSCVAGFVTIGCAASLPQREVHALMNRVGTAFLLRYVAGRPVTDARLGLLDESAEFAVVKGPSDRPAVAPTARPLQAPATPEHPVGTVLLADDLSSAERGTLPPSSSDPSRFSAGYAPGKYEITLSRAAARDAGIQGEVVLPGSYGDASLAVDVELVDATPGRFFQLACRSRDATSQYRFTFNTTTGEGLIVRWLSVPGLDVPRLSLVPLNTVARLAHPDGAPYRAELSCRGTTIAARIDGVTVASVTDNTFASGQFWLAVGEAAGAPAASTRAKARFSNLVVTQE